MTALKTPAADAPASVWGALATRIPAWRNPRKFGHMPYLLSPTGTSNVPDPDHWAWEGWLVRMIGGNTQVQAKYRPRREMWEVCVNAPDSGAPLWGDGSTLGRACIAVAAAYGRWPGGGA